MPYFRFTIHGVEEVEFETRQNLADWLNNQRHFWETIRDEVRRFGQDPLNDFVSAVSKLHNTVSKKNDSDAPDVDKEMDRLFNRVGFASKAREARSIKHIGDNYGWQAGAAAVELLFRQRHSRPNSPVFSGDFEVASSPSSATLVSNGLRQRRTA